MSSRDPDDLLLPDLQPSADKIFIIYQSEIPMSLLHRYAEYCGVYPMKSQDIGRVEIHFFDTVPLGKIPGIPGQFEDFFPDGHFPAYGIQIIASTSSYCHADRDSCRVVRCFFVFRKVTSTISPSPSCSQGDCLAVFIRIARSPVHGQGILLPKIQIQQCDSVVNTVDIHQYSRIRRIIAGPDSSPRSRYPLCRILPLSAMLLCPVHFLQ